MRADRFLPAVQPLEDRSLMSVQYVGSLAVPVTSAAPQATTFTLDSDRAYRVVASGTATIHTNANPALQKVTDAEYVLRPTGPDTFGRSGTTVTDNGLQLGGVGGFVGWGGYADDHIYSVDVTGSGGPLTAYYRDVAPSSYGDNAGSLNLDVYEVTGSVVGRAAVVADGVPTDIGVAGVTVQVVQDNVVVGSVVTGTDGYYEIATLPTGDYTLTATGPADAPYFSLPAGGKPITITDTPLGEDVPVGFDVWNAIVIYLDMHDSMVMSEEAIHDTVADIIIIRVKIPAITLQIALAATPEEAAALTQTRDAELQKISQAKASLYNVMLKQQKLQSVAIELGILLNTVSPATSEELQQSISDLPGLPSLTLVAPEFLPDNVG